MLQMQKDAWKRMKMDEEDGKVARRKEGEEWRGRKKEGLR